MDFTINGIMKIGMFKWSVAFVAFCLLSCKNYTFYSGLYTRADKRTVLIDGRYSPKAEYCLPVFRSCHSIEFPGNALGMSTGSIYFSRDSIEGSLLASFQKHFSLSACAPEKPSFMDSECPMPDKFYSGNPGCSQLDSDSMCRGIIYPVLIVTSSSGKHIEGGGGIEPASDSGKDKHILEFKLVTAIYEGDTLIYMDNRTHWTEVFSQRNERLEYHVPQIVIDSLVSLTLQEYFKRLE